MNNLYNSLAAVYEAMYKTFINYDEEFDLYKQMLVKYNCRSLVEIGCGTGNLASRFNADGFNYTGLDISEDMLAIATQNNPGCTFLQAGMQHFILPKEADAAIITGRTISYLLSNKEVMESMASINKNLKQGGILCFDFIDANKFIPQVKKQSIIHKALVGDKKFMRESFWTVNLNTGWGFDWLSVFYEEKEDGSRVKIGEDNSTIRAFTKDETILFLQLAGFEIKEIFCRVTYAFDTYVVVAEKIREL